MSDGEATTTDRILDLLDHIGDLLTEVRIEARRLEEKADTDDHD